MLFFHVRDHCESPKACFSYKTNKDFTFGLTLKTS